MPATSPKQLRPTERLTLIKAAEQGGKYEISGQVSRQAQPDITTEATVNLSDALPVGGPSELKAIAQVHNTYILR